RRAPARIRGRAAACAARIPAARRTGAAADRSLSGPAASPRMRRWIPRGLAALLGHDRGHALHALPGGERIASLSRARRRTKWGAAEPGPVTHDLDRLAGLRIGGATLRVAPRRGNAATTATRARRRSGRRSPPPPPLRAR